MGGGEGGSGGAPSRAVAPPASDCLVPAVLSAVAVALALVATWRGPGLTDDSVNYLSTGINVAESRGWVMLADQPLTIFPPGLPAIAAVGEATGVGAEMMLRLVSAASFGAIVLLGHRLLRRVVPHRGVVIGSTILLAVSPALLGVAKMAWSEPLFIVVSLLFLLALGTVLDRGTLGNPDVAMLVALSGMAVLVRYIGVSLIALGGIALLLAIRPLDRRALGRITLFGVLSAVVPVACILRNHAVDGSYLGQRIPSTDSLGDSSYRVAVTLGEWLYPASRLAPRTLALLGTALALLVVSGLLVSNRMGRGSGAGGAGRRDAGARRRLLCCAGFAMVYLAYLVVASLGTAFEPINARYLSPVFVPVVVVAAAGVATILGTSVHPLWRRTLGTLLSLLVAVQLASSVDEARTDAVAGIGYSSSGWVDSDLATEASRLVERSDDAVIFSNQPFGLWAGTRTQPIRWAPLETGFRGARVVGELEALARQVACAPESTYLVRYRYGSPRVFSNKEIGAAVDVRRVTVADDGAIFKLTPRNEVACSDAPALPTSAR